MSEEDPLIAGGEESKGAIKLFKESIAALKLIPIDLWLAYATAYAQVFQMFGLWLILPLLLSEEYGYSDTLAGSVFGALGGVQWFYSLCLGTFIDKLGVKVAIILAGTIGIVAGIWLTFAQDEILFMFGLLILFPLGGALDHPATRIAPRRYTTDECRPAAYSILFWIMQAAQCTTFGADDAILQLSSDGAMGLTRFRQITLLGTFVCAGGLIAALFIKEKDYEGTGNEEVDPLGAKFTTWEILRSLFAHKNFWRFIGLISMTIGCRTAYRMLDAVIPKYMERTMGEGSMYGTVLLTNPLGNLVFTPLLVPLVYVFSQYTLIVFATIIVWGACFIPLIGSTYFILILFVVIMAVGESLFLPRIWDYTIQISSKGKEGTYMAMAGFPIMIGQFMGGIVSGLLLSEFWSKEGDENCPLVWMFTGFIASSSVVFLIMFRWLVEEPSYDPEPFMPCSEEGKERMALLKRAEK